MSDQNPNDSMNALVRRNLETSLQIGSIDDLMKASEVVMLLIDTSGSMSSYVQKANKRRIDCLRDVVGQIKATGESYPMIAFGGPFDAQVRFVDVVPEPDGGTPLHAAIPYAKQYGATRLVVISDGVPDLRDQCMIEARAFGGQIDVVFVGDPTDTGTYFMDELAKATGGRRIQGDFAETKKLTSTIMGLLTGGDEPAKRAPIQGEGFSAIEKEDEPEDDDEEFEDDDEDDDDDEEEEDEE